MSKITKNNIYYFEDGQKRSSSNESLLNVLKEHESYLRNFLNIRLAGHPDKDDLMQEVLLRLMQQDDLQSRLSYGSEKTRAYLTIIASNLIRDMNRKQQVHQRVHETILREQQLSTDKRLLENQEVTRRKLVAVDKVLASFSPKCQEAFKLSRFYNLSYREVAQQMNISPSMVRKYIAQALIALKTKIDFEEGFL